VYREFFGLKTDPFRVNPDPSFLYLADGHREALATLTYAVRERKGFAVLTGEVGTGKTTVLNSLLGDLPETVETAYVFNTRLDVEDLFAYILDEFGLMSPDPFRKSAALHLLNGYLIERLEKGLQTLLIVDEAQNLSVDLLEEVRMLSNLETPKSKLLQILLVGQPELNDLLNRPDLRQLRQRVELFCRIDPLTILETAEYVPSRLRAAGHETGEVFTDSSLHSIFRYTRGIPRVINVLCDNALLSAFAASSPRVSDNTIHDVARDMGLSRSAHYQFQPPPSDRPTEAERLRAEEGARAPQRAVGAPRAGSLGPPPTASLAPIPRPEPAKPRGWRRLFPAMRSRQAHAED